MGWTSPLISSLAFHRGQSQTAPHEVAIIPHSVRDEQFPGELVEVVATTLYLG